MSTAADYRSFQIVYGGLTIGASDSAGFETHIDAEGGMLKVNQSVETFTIDFNFFIAAKTTAVLVTAATAIEAELKKIRQSVQVNMGGSTLWSFTHSANTGFNSRATISKSGGTKDTALSRSYTVHIEVGLPFMDSGLNGRRSSQISMSYSPNRRLILNMAGEYTCQGGSHNAEDTYLQAGAVEAYVTAVKAALPDSNLVFERTSEDYSYDDQNKVLNFTITEQEILYKEGKSTVNDPDIFNQSLSMQLHRKWPGDSPEESWEVRYRVTSAVVQYSCLVKKSSNPTGSPTDLEAVYFDKIRPFLIDEILNSTELDKQSISTVTLLDETVSYDKNSNGISATVQADITVGNNSSTVLHKTLNIADDEKLGAHLVPVWATENKEDQHLLKYLYEGPGSHTRTVTAVYRVMTAVMDDKNTKDFLGDSMSHVIPSGEGWILVEQHADATVLEIGTPSIEGADPYTITDYTLSATAERYISPGLPTLSQAGDEPARTGVEGAETDEERQADEDAWFESNEGPAGGRRQGRIERWVQADRDRPLGADHPSLNLP